jgi:hypothetical protein
MRVDPTLIPIVALIVAFGIASVSLHFNNRTRELRHRERLSALEKGIDLPPDPVRGPNAYLLRGLIWLFIGLGISIFFPFDMDQ